MDHNTTTIKCLIRHHFDDPGNVNPNRNLALGILFYVHVDPELHGRNIQSAHCVLKHRDKAVDASRIRRYDKITRWVPPVHSQSIVIIIALTRL